MQVSIPNRMLVKCEENSPPTADWAERTSNTCLFFLRTALGYTFHPFYTGGSISKTNSVAMRALAGLMAFTLWLPITLIGLVVCACSRSHALLYEVAQKQFQIRNIQQRVLQIGHDPVQLVQLYKTEIATMQKSPREECMATFTQTQLEILTRQLKLEQAQGSVFEDLILNIDQPRKEDSLDTHIQRVASIPNAMGFNNVLEWLENRDASFSYSPAVYLALNEIRKSFERPIHPHLTIAQDRDERIQEIAASLRVWCNAYFKYQDPYIMPDSPTVPADLLSKTFNLEHKGPFSNAIGFMTLVFELSSARTVDNAQILFESLQSILRQQKRDHLRLKCQIKWVSAFRCFLKNKVLSNPHTPVQNKIASIFFWNMRHSRILKKASKTLRNPLIPQAVSCLQDFCSTSLIYRLTIQHFETIISLESIFTSIGNLNSGIVLNKIVSILDRSRSENLKVIQSAVDAALTACVPLEQNENPIVRELKLDGAFILERRVLLEETIHEALKASLLPECRNLVLDYFMTVPAAAPKDAMGLHAFNL